MRRLVLSFAILAMTGCATLFEGPSQDLTIRTAPVGASCRLDRDGELLGVIPSTPGSVSIHRTPSDISVLCTKPGWQPTRQSVESKFNGTTISNILLLPAAGIVGVTAGAISDASTGANHSYDSPPYILMQPLVPSDGYLSPIPQSPFSDRVLPISPPSANPSNPPALALR